MTTSNKDLISKNLAQRMIACINDYVKLLFAKDVAEDVLNYNFHPTQKIKQNEDGTVTVKFKASGSLAIMWHLFKWGGDVKIISPTSLKKEYKNYLQNVLNNAV